MASDSKTLQERYDFLAGNFLNIQTLEDAWKAMRFIFDRAEEKWACDDLTLLSYRPEKKIQKSYFRVFYLSLKLDELVDVSLSDKEWIIRCLEVFGEATEKALNFILLFFHKNHRLSTKTNSTRTPGKNFSNPKYRIRSSSSQS